MSLHELPIIGNNNEKNRYQVPTAILDKEKRWNENCIQQKQKLYANKYNLQQKNIYHDLFCFINDKIRCEIEINEKRIMYNTDDRDDLFVLKSYNKMYNKSSKEILRLLKTQPVNSLRDSVPNNMKYMQAVKSIDIRQVFKKKSIKPNNAVECRVFKHDRDANNTVRYLKIEKKLRTQAENLKNRLDHDENNVLQPLMLLNDRLPKHINKKYSKNAYLASLNYDFSNPIL